MTISFPPSHPSYIPDQDLPVPTNHSAERLPRSKAIDDALYHSSRSPDLHNSLHRQQQQAHHLHRHPSSSTNSPITPPLPLHLSRPSSPSNLHHSGPGDRFHSPLLHPIPRPSGLRGSHLDSAASTPIRSQSPVTIDHRSRSVDPSSFHPASAPATPPLTHSPHPSHHSASSQQPQLSLPSIISLQFPGRSDSPSGRSVHSASAASPSLPPPVQRDSRRMGSTFRPESPANSVGSQQEHPRPRDKAIMQHERMPSNGDDRRNSGRYEADYRPAPVSHRLDAGPNGRHMDSGRDFHHSKEYLSSQPYPKMDEATSRSLYASGPSASMRPDHSPGHSPRINNRQERTSPPSHGGPPSREPSEHLDRGPARSPPSSSITGLRCANCGVTSTPLWRRAPDGSSMCNACGLYMKSHSSHRATPTRRSANPDSPPKAAPALPVVKPSGEDEIPAGTCPGDGLCNGTGGTASCSGCPAYNNNLSHALKAGRGGSSGGCGSRNARPSQDPAAASTTSADAKSGQKATPAPEQTKTEDFSGVVGALRCTNCQTTTTPLWRQDEDGNNICNACGLYQKLHGTHRPIGMKKNVIKRRKRIPASAPSQNTNNAENNVNANGSQPIIAPADGKRSKKNASPSEQALREARDREAAMALMEVGTSRTRTSGSGSTGHGSPGPESFEQRGSFGPGGAPADHLSLRGSSDVGSPASAPRPTKRARKSYPSSGRDDLAEGLAHGHHAQHPPPAEAYPPSPHSRPAAHPAHLHRYAHGELPFAEQGVRGERPSGSPRLSSASVDAINGRHESSLHGEPAGRPSNGSAHHHHHHHHAAHTAHHGHHHHHHHHHPMSSGGGGFVGTSAPPPGYVPASGMVRISDLERHRDELIYEKKRLEDLLLRTESLLASARHGVYGPEPPYSHHHGPAPGGPMGQEALPPHGAGVQRREMRLKEEAMESESMRGARHQRVNSGSSSERDELESPRTGEAALDRGESTRPGESRGPSRRNSFEQRMASLPVLPAVPLKRTSPSSGPERAKGQGHAWGLEARQASLNQARKEQKRSRAADGDDEEDQWNWDNLYGKAKLEKAGDWRGFARPVEKERSSGRSASRREAELRGSMALQTGPAPASISATSTAAATATAAGQS